MARDYHDTKTKNIEVPLENYDVIEKELELLRRDRLLEYLHNVPTRQLEQLVDQLNNPKLHRKMSYRSRTKRLSSRETQVLVLVANGYSRADISHTLDISPNTAARHIANTYKKLDISNVAEATTYAIAAGLVTIVDPEGKPN